MVDRRSFLKSTASAGIALALPSRGRGKYDQEPLEVHIFSKHLQFLDFEEMAAMAAEIGFDGVELTVRPKGHVLPERVREDLPLAVSAIRAAGIKASMIASDINDLSNAVNQNVLAAIEEQGIENYRMRYYKYPKTGDLLNPLLEFRDLAEGLSEYNEKKGLCAVYQNHAGVHFGSSMWEIRQLCEGLPTETIGCQYDLRHATVEGGLSWQKEIRLILPLIKSIVIKDFLWEKVEGRYKVVNVPLGDGMADFPTFFALLKKHEIKVPAVLHLEYPIAGAEHGDRDLSSEGKAVVYEAMRKDLKRLHRLWDSA